MGKLKSLEKYSDQGGGGGSTNELSEKTHCADPLEISHQSLDTNDQSTAPIALTTESSPPTPTFTDHCSMRPFSRQYGRKYHLLDEPTRNILHTAARTASLPKLPIGKMNIELDPIFAATACRLMDEIATTLKAIQFHEDYFPRRHSERQLMHDQLRLTTACLKKYLKAWRIK